MVRGHLTLAKRGLVAGLLFGLFPNYFGAGAFNVYHGRDDKSPRNVRHFPRPRSPCGIVNPVKSLGHEAIELLAGLIIRWWMKQLQIPFHYALSIPLRHSDRTLLPVTNEQQSD